MFEGELEVEESEGTNKEEPPKGEPYEILVPAVDIGRNEWETAHDYRLYDV